MPLRDESEEIVVCVAEDRAVVIDAPSEARRSRWGRRIADLTSSEWVALLRTLEPATRSFVESQRLTGCLVELDQTSREMMKTAKVITEEGGWIQSALRGDRGRVTRLMRIRPATGVAAMSGAAAVLGAIAAQAQTAEMARDIKVIRQRMDELYKHLQSDQIGEVENAVEQVEDLVELLRAHGEHGVQASDFSVIRNALGSARHKCLHHLQDAVKKLEDAEYRSPRQAEKNLSKEAVEEAMLYLDLLAKCYAATVQFGLAELAFAYHQNKPDVARTLAERITQSTAELRAEIEDAHRRLGRLDGSVHVQRRPASRKAKLPSAVADAMINSTVSDAVKKLAGKSVPLGSLRGTAISLPATSIVVGGSALALVAGSVNAKVQSHAKKTLDARLEQLTEAIDRSSHTLEQAAPSLEALRTLTEEPAVPGSECTDLDPS
ncbi:hypothetical protein [Streptomyces sp. CB02400]|uniref:hypothetical protein n=1 Tax=Streptomyces sp. CB02400 TaxID=1703944 RepID=UPI00093B2169|nr:hypothetical protein [Streptomyces sp. CB02400]OKJ88891.1 hypothetical protein AMK33_37425 [Streptomyces sp. CB02400]